METQEPCAKDEPCTEGKLLSLHTAIVCLSRALALSGALDREIFKSELDHGLQWLTQHDEKHAAQSFQELLPMLKTV